MFKIWSIFPTSLLVLNSTTHPLEHKLCPARQQCFDVDPEWYTCNYQLFSVVMFLTDMCILEMWTIHYNETINQIGPALY